MDAAHHRHLIGDENAKPTNRLVSRPMGARVRRNAQKLPLIYVRSWPRTVCRDRQVSGKSYLEVSFSAVDSTAWLTQVDPERSYRPVKTGCKIGHEWIPGDR